MACSHKRLKVGAGDTATLLQAAIGNPQGMRQQQAFAFRNRKFAEDHAAAPL
jgi:hypothetical protein